MGNIFGSKPKAGPSAAQQAEIQRRAAEEERERLRQEDEAKKAQSELEKSKQLDAEEAKRKALVGQLQEAGQEPSRRRFLKGV